MTGRFITEAVRGCREEGVCGREHFEKGEGR